jgi:hypothetical protein
MTNNHQQNKITPPEKNLTTYDGLSVSLSLFLSLSLSHTHTHIFIRYLAMATLNQHPWTLTLDYLFGTNIAITIWYWGTTNKNNENKMLTINYKSWTIKTWTKMTVNNSSIKELTTQRSCLFPWLSTGWLLTFVSRTTINATLS